MRRIESVILAVVVGLLGVGVWQAEPLLPALSSKSETAHANASANLPEAAWVNLRRELPTPLKRSRAAVRQSRSNALLGKAFNSESITVVSVPSAASIPRAGDMTIGATRTQVRTSYGDPMLETALMRDGRLVQRYYYFNNDQTQFTVATLENGRVVSAEGTAR